MDSIYKLCQAFHPWAVEVRRALHAHPEISGHELRTQEAIAAYLTELGIPCRKAAKTGLIAELGSERPGKTVVIRADIDALPLADACGKPYQSQNAGACHACGHDGHTAIALGAAKVLAALADERCGTFRFLFQPREEAFPSGAVDLIADGALEGADSVIGAHIWQPLPLGVIGISCGALMASPDKFTITVQGRGGHGSMPQQSVDPILTAAQIIVALNTVISRSLDPLAAGVLSVGSVHSGEAFNIIPDSAVIEGTVRSFDESVRQTVFKRIREIAAGICAAHGARCEVDSLFGHPPVINDETVALQVEQAAALCQSGARPQRALPVMCGEDFSYYLHERPGAFFLIGTGTEECVWPHHHPKFDIDELCLLHGMEVMARAALQLAR